MCWAYSGRCYLSLHLAGRSSNRGECAQACRWKYYLLEGKTPGVYMPVEEDSRGIYILNARDLCLIDYLGRLADQTAVVEMRNRFAAGERLEVFGPKTECREFVVTDLRNADGEPIREAVRVQEHVSLAM